jgi:hypothetical protein
LAHCSAGRKVDFDLEMHVEKNLATGIIQPTCPHAGHNLQRPLQKRFAGNRLPRATSGRRPKGTPIGAHFATPDVRRFIAYAALASCLKEAEAMQRMAPPCVVLLPSMPL